MSFVWGGDEEMRRRARLHQPRRPWREALREWRARRHEPPEPPEPTPAAQAAVVPLQREGVELAHMVVNVTVEVQPEQLGVEVAVRRRGKRAAARG